MEAANRLNIHLLCLDSPDAPATQISSKTHVQGHFKNPEDIRALAKQCDLLTVEIEHVDVQTLEELSETLPIHPSPKTLKIIQDKYQQKVFFSQLDKENDSKNVPVSEFMDLKNPVEDLKHAAKEFGLPLMVKSKTLAYDGRGNSILKSVSEIPEAIQTLGGGPAQGGPGLYVEQWVPFVKELAVIVARNTQGQVQSYPCVETIQKDNICHLVIAPAQIDGLLAEKAKRIAEDAVASLEGAGVFGVEMFLLDNGRA